MLKYYFKKIHSFLELKLGNRQINAFLTKYVVFKISRRQFGKFCQKYLHYTKYDIW